MVPVSALAQTRDGRDKDGQYFCVVDQAAGIRPENKEENSPAFSGNVRLPEEDTKFIIVRRAIELVEPPFMREHCKRSTDFWLDEKLAQTTSPKDNEFPRRFIGKFCFSTEQILWKSGQRVFEYRGYDGFEYFGATAGSWIKLYRDDSFFMGFDYDFGSVIEAGHCTRIEPPK